MPCICLVECQLLPYNCTAQNRSWWAPRWRKVRGMPSQLVLLARKHRVDSGFEGKELSLFEIRLSQYLGSRRIEVQPLWMTRLDRRVDSSLCKWDAQYPDFACKTTKPSNINSSRWKQKQSTWHRENVIETCKYRNKPRYREGSSSRNARWSCVCSLRHCMAPPPPYLSKNTDWKNGRPWQSWEGWVTRTQKLKLPTKLHDFILPAELDIYKTPFWTSFRSR